MSAGQEMTLDPLRDLRVDGLRADRVAEMFYRNGLVVFERTVPEDWIAHTMHSTMRHLERQLDSIGSEYRQNLGTGLEVVSSELAQRSSGRFDVSLSAGVPATAALLPGGAAPILAAISAILGQDWRVELHGAVVALPGAQEMAWHVDGSHLFPELPLHLPAHALNLFIPLVDIPEEMGPTEFCPGSQFLTRGTRPSYVQPSVPPESLHYTGTPVRAAVPAGTALLADFRTLHRALPNRSERPRPLLYFSCAKPWFRDGSFAAQRAEDA